MAPQSRSSGFLALCLLVLLLAAPASAAKPTMVLQIGQSGATTGFAYSPDGKTLATGGADGVRLWETASGQLTAVLRGEFGPLFSPDGETLATASHNVTTGLDMVQLRDTASGQLKVILQGQWEGVPTIAFSADGKTLAAGGSDDKDNPIAQLWDVASGQLKTVLNGATGPLAFSPDGQILAATDAEDAVQVQLWDVASGQFKATLDLAVSAAVLAFSPDGRTLAAGGSGGVKLWDVASGQLKKTLEPRGPVPRGLPVNLIALSLKSLAFSPDGQMLGIACGLKPFLSAWRDAVQLWDVESGLRKLNVAGAIAFAFAPNGKTAATAGPDAQLWDVASGQLKAVLKGVAAPLAFSPDGKTLATGSGDGTARFWDVASGQLKASLEGRGEQVVWGATLSPDGNKLATGSVDGRLWDMASGQLKGTLKDEDNPVFSPDSQTLATVSYNAATQLSTVRLWDTVGGQLKAAMPNEGGPLFSPDSQTLATASWNPTTKPGTVEVQLRDVASGHVKVTLKDTGWPVAFSPNGRTLATTDGRLWDVTSGQLKAALPVAPGYVNGLAFSPDSMTLATGSAEGTARLWDVASGQLKATLTHVGFPFAFSPDGQTLATAEGRLWDVASGQLKAILTGAGSPLVFAPDSMTLATGGNSARLWEVASGQLRATLKGEAWQLAFSIDGKTLATRDYSRRLHLWDVASANPIPITAQTSLDQLPPWLTHPFSIGAFAGASSEVSLLDPVDEHIMATLQALPNAPASLFTPPPDPAAAPPTGGNWITTTPDGYFEGSANLVPFIRWSVDGWLFPAATFWDVYYRPDLVRQALRIPGG